MQEATEIYMAPNIRTQTLEQAQDRIQQKRVSRLIMAQKHQQTMREKAVNLLGKQKDAFAKQANLFEKDMERVQVMLDKMTQRSLKMAEIHANAVDNEGIINGEPNF